ncbi:MAG TPA: cytochrome c oxidase assembly protein [Solirubrobacteraceae bacterium]|nr:cytochrome c oxidase assembly protein [Solirubrobacteraceae bacterium]
MPNVPGWGSWSVVPLLWLLLLLAGGWYASVIRRMERDGRRVSVGGCAAFYSGLLIILIALGSPLNTIADNWLLLGAMMQHTLVADIAPPLFVLGIAPIVSSVVLPEGIRRHFAAGTFPARAWAVLTRPLVAVPLWMVTLLSFSIPPVFDYTVQHPVIHAFDHLLLFSTGFVMWWAIINPLHNAGTELGMGRVMMLAASRGASGLVCLPLTFLNTTLFSYYSNLPRGFSISPINDQRLAGASMCLIEFLVFGIAVAIVFIDALNRTERADALADLAAANH